MTFKRFSLHHPQLGLHVFATCVCCCTCVCVYVCMLSQCGGGMQTRNVLCTQVIDGRPRIAATSNCQATMPSTAQACNTQTCSTTPVTYYWFVSDWSSCSRNCGGGFQFRSVIHIFIAPESICS